MSDSKKLFSPREAALAVLARTKAILEESSLAKSEKLKKDGGQTLGGAIGFPGAPPVAKSEYKTENNPKPGVKYGKIETAQKADERDYNEYEVKSGNSRDSSGPRLKKQVSPSGNPKEAAEGNNKPDGMDPEYEFKDKVAKELAKEKASHMVKSQSGMHTVVYQPMQKSESQGNDLKKSEKLEKGDWKKIHDKLEREGYSKKSADKIDGSIKAKLGKGENPDEKQDAALGEKVEHDVEQHVQENEAAEAQEGNSMAKPGDKMEGQTERSSIPMCIGSAKLSKFMEWKHSKRKNAQAQSPEAVGNPAAGAPQPGSTQNGHPDNSRPKTQPTDGDVDKVGKR